MEIKEYEDKVKNILIEKINSLIDSLSRDFKKNYNKKENNWILGDFDEKIISNMVFVSTFESKSGNMMENIATDIIKIKLGENNVPLILKGANISDEEYNNFVNGHIKGGKNAQGIISKFDLKECKKIASRFREDNRGQDRQNSSLDQQKLYQIIKDKPKITDIITFKPVDLIYLKDGKINLMEIKAGGDLDSSNAPGNIDKMFTWVAMLGKECNLYFSTLYHKDGEGNLWKGGIKKFLGNDMILIGKQFWEEILPDGINFDTFKKLYFEACSEVNLNKKMTNLIKSVISE